MTQAKLRITAGKYKGRVVKTPGDEKTHPMGERERLALFNMIGNDLSEKTVLDAYAGSGALGIEALSRGAKKVTFVEKSPKAAQIIAENLAEIPGEKTTLIRGDVNNLENMEKVALILADPPYQQFTPTEVEKLATWLEPGGVLVLSHPDMAPKLDNLELRKSKKYARAHLSIYDKTE